MTISLVPDSLADYLLQLEAPFEASDLSEDGVFDAEPGLLDALDSSQDDNLQVGWSGCFRSLHY